MKITDHLIKRQPVPTKNLFIRDDELVGFGIKITPKGQTSFIAEGRVKGSGSKRVTLGRFPIINTKEARLKAKAILAKLGDGIDPVAEEKRRRIEQAKPAALDKAASATLSELFDKFLDARSLKPKTERDYRNVMKNHFSDWMQEPVRGITRSLVENRYRKLLSPKGKGIGTGGGTGDSPGKARANKAMRILSSILSFGMGEEIAEDQYLITSNPVEVLKRHRNRTLKPRNSFIETEDLWKVLYALEKDREHCTESGSTVRDWLVLVLFTGVRREEGLQLKWKDLDFDHKWFILHDTKNGLDHIVPMSSPVEYMLKRRESNKNSPFVFPSIRDPKHPIVEPRKEIQKVADESTISFTPHDLRRTFASICYAVGLDHTIIKRAMNHKQKDITEAYIQTKADQLREPFEQVAEHIGNAVDHFSQEWSQSELQSPASKNNSESQ